MMKNKMVFGVILTLILGFSFHYFLSRLEVISFEDIYNKKKGNELDIRNLSEIEYDELTFWAPYANICDLGISGFDKNSSHCENTNEDSECYLLFLKNNQLVGKVRVNRKKLDFATSRIEWRVKKDKARFKILSKKDFPKLILL